MYTSEISFDSSGPRVTVYRDDQEILTVGHWGDDGYIKWAEQIVKDLETLGEEAVLGKNG